MSRRGISFLLTALLLIPILTGCWDYRGLDQMTIIAGLAIDESKDSPGDLTLTFEIVDTTAPSEQGQLSAKLFQSDGPTVFEAIHNSNKQLYREMYFGNMEVLIISHQLAASRGLDAIIDAFLRDFSTRDNLILLISSEDTAGELLEPKDGGDSNIISYQINDGLSENKGSINATRTVPLYKVYNSLTRKTDELALPVMGFLDQEEKTLTSNGMAVFKGDSMVSYLLDDHTPSYLLATEKLVDGTYTFDAASLANGENAPVTVSINRSTPEQSFHYSDGKVTMSLHVKILARAIEISPLIRHLDIQRLEQQANHTLEQQITDTIRGVQEGSGADIFHFGETVYRRDPAQWRQLAPDWEQLFREAEVIVTCDFTINDTGLISEYGR